MTFYLSDPDIGAVGEEVAEFVSQPSPADVDEYAVPLPLSKTREHT